MNKADLIEKIAKDAGINKTQADAAINSVLGELKKGGRVSLVGFGSFSVGSRKARTGRNPQTGKEIKIPAKKVAKFSAGAELKSKIRGQATDAFFHDSSQEIDKVRERISQTQAEIEGLRLSTRGALAGLTKSGSKS